MPDTPLIVLGPETGMLMQAPLPYDMGNDALKEVDVLVHFHKEISLVAS